MTDIKSMDEQALRKIVLSQSEAIIRLINQLEAQETVSDKMTDIKEQKYCDICGSPKVWCMCDNSIGEPTIQSLASALTIAKMTVAYQRELILKLSKPSPSDVSVTQDVLMDIETDQSIENEE